MSSKEYSDYIPNSLKSYDKSIIVEELLEKLKAQGCFDAKRKQFLNEITNKSTYQNLHTKVENLATKFLETVRWPPSVQKHQLREQLRLHIQSTDQFNNCVSRLIEQEVNCKIQGELKPMIESKACEYLEVNYEKWKQSMLSHIYEKFEVDSPIEIFSQKMDIKKESIYTDTKMEVDNDIEVSQSTIAVMNPMKSENNFNQSNIVNSSSFNCNIQPIQKPSINNARKSPQIIHSSYNATTPPSMPPPIGLLPPPHRILPNNLFQPLPPPPPPMFLPVGQFPPPPPPEDKSLPPPPPPENGPNTPTDDYIPKFQDIPTEKVKTGLLKTPEKPIDKTVEIKIVSPKKMIWGQIVLPVQDISEDSASDSDKNEHERRRYSRKSPPQSKHSNTIRTVNKQVEAPPSHNKESWKNPDKPMRTTVKSHTRQKSNDYTDVSSESLNEMEFKDVQQSSHAQLNKLNNIKKVKLSSSSDDSHSSSSNDHTLDFIRKINKKKTKHRKRQKTPTLAQSSSSYSSSDSSSESSSSDNSHRNQTENSYRDVQRGYRVFGRSQSEEKDMDISVDTHSPSIDPKWNSPRNEIKLDTPESVQMRRNQIKARLEEIDAKRSFLQKQQVLSTNEPCSVTNTTSSSSTDSSSENTTSSRSSKTGQIRDPDSKMLSDSKNNQISDNDLSINPYTKNETCSVDLDVKTEHDSEPEEGELSSESRGGSVKREINTNSSEETKSINNDNASQMKKEESTNEQIETITDNNTN